MLTGSLVRSATSLAVMPLRVTFKASSIKNALAKDWLLLGYGNSRSGRRNFSHVERIATNDREGQGPAARRSVATSAE